MGCGFIELPEISTNLWLEWNDRGLRRAHWAAPHERAQDALGPDCGDPEPIPEPYGSDLSRYFAGERVDLAQLPLDLQGTPFQLSVWRALLRVPHGAVRSYASIAHDVGSPRGMRAVGSANGKNPVAVIVPCHRIVESGMRLGGYSSGLHVKRHLLRLEGVKLVGDDVHAGQLALLP